jgi:lysophospholipase L1-like esterase
VNITDPNNIPQDARVISADDLLRYEKLGVDAVAAVNGLALEVESYNADETVAAALATPTSATRLAVDGLVTGSLVGMQAKIDAIPGTVTAKLDADVPIAVGEAIASDGTIRIAAENAVTTEIGIRDLVESDDARLPQQANDDTFVRGWADTSDKLALGIRSSGTVEAPVFDSGLLNGMKIERLNSDVTGMHYALVDAEGRMAEAFAVATDGRFPQWVIDSISSRIGVVPTGPAPTTLAAAKAILPANLYLIAGELHTLYHENVIRNKRADQWVRLKGSTGYFNDRWQLTPTAGTITLTFDIMNADNSIAETRSISVQTIAKPAAGTVKWLAIGDSITQNTQYIKTAVAQQGGKAVGTRTFDNGVTSHEGRGGWSLDSYFSRYGRTDGIDSPFMFPVGVAGDKYRGNTAFWKAALYTDTAGYLSSGYTKAGSGWTDSTLDFNASGYPISPATGDVVYDPALAAGTQWQEWSGSAWTTRGTQPAWEFNFSKYMARYAFIFAAEGAPTVVTVMLGTNDFGSVLLTDQRLADYKTRMDSLIASVRAYSATLPVVLLTPPTGGPQDKWEAKPYGETHLKEFDDKMKGFADYIFTTYGASTANKVFVGQTTGAVALANHADWVHPDTTGHNQMAPWVAGAIAKAGA